MNNAQNNDSIFVLDEFIKNTRLDETKSYNKTANYKPNNNQINNSTIDELLSSKSAVFIKSYGPGYLSSISLRGGNAQQTSVVWNGFVINSPLNGICDLSTIPNSFVDEIDLLSGNSASLWGNGGISGAIHLSNNYKFNDSLKIRIGSSIGSFSNVKNYFNIKKGFKNWHTSFRFFHNKNQNDFSILNPTTNETKKQTNSSIYQLSLMNENYFHLGSKSFLKIIGIYQRFKRKIPPTLNEQFSFAQQDDNIVRIFSDLKIIRNKNSVNIKSTFFNTVNNYYNTTSSIDSHNPSTSFLNEIDFKNNSLRNHQFSASIMNTYCFSNGNNYANKISQNRWAATLMYNWRSKNEKWTQSFNTRQVLNNNEFTPLTFSYGFNWKAFKQISIYGNIGKIYRLPTINDLYWNPGGNINLQPENGYSNDVGLIASLNIKNIEIVFEPTLFNRKINNWIIWYPNGSFWSPQNILSVWSRGIETATSVGFSIKNNLRFNMNFNSTYVLSTNEQAYYPNDQSIGKQLIYTPYYVFNLDFSLVYKNIAFRYSHSYNGYRFTSSDNLNLLEAFNVANLQLAYDTKINKYPINIFYKMNNVFNENYQVVLNRPMPLINHEIGFNININKK
ncbi:MAG: TonB-dependent receptor [Flavobacteriales bacterium]|nr:TonB-dependent receptor [Flavobacteriales bacterium]